MIRTLLVEQPKVLAYIQSMVRQPELADDIFQDVCALAMEKRAQIRDEDHLRNWLRTTSRLQALNAIRKRRQAPVLLDDATWEAIEGSWGKPDGTDPAGYADLLRRCMLRLSENHRNLLRRRFVDDLDYRTLSAECNRTVNSLYVTFSRIYATLGRCIADHATADRRVHHDRPIPHP